MRYGKPDDNQEAIVKALRAIGCSVAVTSVVGNGFPDLVVGRGGRTYLLEVKDGDKFPSAQSLTGREAVFHDEWRGHVAIVNSVKTALAAVGAELQ